MIYPPFYNLNLILYDKSIKVNNLMRSKHTIHLKHAIHILIYAIKKLYVF